MLLQLGLLWYFVPVRESHTIVCCTSCCGASEEAEEGEREATAEEETGSSEGAVEAATFASAEPDFCVEEEEPLGGVSFGMAAEDGVAAGAGEAVA